MKGNCLHRFVIVAVMAVFVQAVQAGTVTVSGSAPTVDGSDVANLSWTDSTTDKVWSDATNPGQSFTTDSKGGTLNALSFQINTTGTPSANRVYRVRVVTIDGSGNTSTVANETGHAQSANWSPGDWFTWTLDTPVELLPNTLYGIDIEHTGGGSWGNGIPYMRYNRTDDIAGGYRYTKTDGDPATVARTLTWDRVFHIDIEPPPPAGTLFYLE